MAQVESRMELQQHSGKLVALEGYVDAISTQLLLLPPSQKILVLPSLLETLPHPPINNHFNARAFVRHVHAKFAERTETARAFLRSSTATHPRLVLMNGGSVAARTACISNICDRLTNGNVEAAEAIFDEIVRDGVTGLMRSEEGLPEGTLAHKSTASTEEKLEEEDHTSTPTREEKVGEDATTRAMKAADSLDRETAVLEAEYEQLEAEYIHQERNLGTGSNLFGRGSSDPPAQILGLHKIINTSRPADDIVQTVVTIPSRIVHANKRQDAPNQHSPGTPEQTTNVHRSQNDNDDDDDEADDQDIVIPDDGSMPHTPGVVYGEACIVDVHSVSPKKQWPGIRKVKSLDRFYPRDVAEHENTELRYASSTSELKSRPTFSGDRDEANLYPQEFFQLPRTTFVRASQTTIKRSLPSSGSLRSTASEPRVRVFVDRGTGAEDSHNVVAQTQTSKQNVERVLEPVLGLVEDMIIRFTGGPANAIFESVIQEYRSGSYPNDCIARLNSTSNPNTTQAPVSDSVLRPQPHVAAETDGEGLHRGHEFDPYASHNDQSLNAKQWPGQKNLSMTDSAVQDLEPPSPSTTPPPQTSGFANFFEFVPESCDGTINVQDTFRAFLGLHFPAGNGGYTQHYFSATPESDRLWKPVWGDEGKNIDQIIALGCEHGVKEDFFSLVSGQIEKLGTKRDGRNRSGSVDLRYFISNVINSLSNLSTAHSVANILSNPGILATLLIPQLEAFLACNTKVQLLILTYPSEHLATVIALRALIGQSILKIAGVIDSLASDPPSFTPRPRTPSSHPLSNEATSSPTRKPLSHANPIRTLQKGTSSHLPQKSEAIVSFSKADYLLPSIATDVEISSFLSGIWMSLIEKSTFYTPEPEPTPLVVEKIVEKIVEKPMPPPTPTSSHTPISYRMQQGKELRDSKISRMTGGDASSSKARGHHYAASVSTIRTTGSERVRRERKNEEEWANFYIGEEDSDDDSYDRMILGRAGVRITPEEVKQTAGKKRSSKKALKWLGLA